MRDKVRVEMGFRLRQTWILACLALCGAMLTAYLLLIKNNDDASVLIVQDALDPMIGLLEPYAGNSLQRLNPYLLAQELPGLNGMALVFGTQARPYKERLGSSGYIPLYTTTVVIAVNRNGNSVNTIKGWRSLLESEAVVLIPHNATEGGRLAAIALAQGLGAQEGNFTPAVEALAYLNSKNRLNHQEEYRFQGYEYMYSFQRLSEFDAIVLWDYQARTLTRSSDDWDIIVPEEGAFSVDCGLMLGELSDNRANLERTKAFLLSALGRQALSEAGFAPFAGEADLSNWDLARLTYNPQFRRSVLLVKLFAPASVLERLLLQSITMLLFCIAGQRILRHVPRGLYRTTSFYSMLFVLLWMLTGIAKTLSMSPNFTRYYWYATYIPRHMLPVCWYCMCFVNQYVQLPPRKSLISLISLAVLLSIFVLTNDLHRQIFIYSDPDPATWTNRYDNGWGYYLSFLWSFSLSIAGVVLLTGKKMALRQRRLMIYAGALFAILFIYQVSYVVGVKYVIDFDIPTTVAVFILLFNLTAQRERFMGASLLALPIFQNLPYAIAVYDSDEQVVYRNASMTAIGNEDILIPYPAQEQYEETAEIFSGKRVYRPQEYVLDIGRALVLEDITDIKRLEQSLQVTQKKLNAVRLLLARQAEEAPLLISKLEQERYSLQMDQLFKEKLEEARRCLRQVPERAARDYDNMVLRRVRFLLCICQQRLRFIIRSLEAHPFLPTELVERYTAGVMKDGQRVGLDGVITATSRGACPSSIAAVLLEAIDSICLYAFDWPDSSLICRLEADEAGITLNAVLSLEGNTPSSGGILPENIIQMLSGLGGQVYQEMEEDALLMRLSLRYAEVAG